MIKKLTLSITLLLLIVVANFAPLVTEKVEAQGSNNQNSIQWSITPVTFTTTVSTFSVSVTASSPQAAGIINNEAVARIYAAGINLTTGGASGGWFSTYLKEIPFSIAGSGATLQGSLNITGLDPQTNYQMLVQLPRVAVYSPIVTFNTDQTGQNNGGQIDQSSGADVSGAGEQTDRTATLPTCSLNPLSFHFAGCIAQGVYYIFFVPTSFVFALSGQLLDWAMGYTLDSNSYSGAGAGFVEKGWKITRDIANIFFIFILLYTAIGMILELHSVNAKKTIATVVVVALLLNFSLFFTKIIIDSSNILGGIFYNNIGTSNADTVPNPWINPNTKNVSTAIVSRFNPQKIFQDSTQLNVQTSSGIKDVNEDGPQATQFLIVSLIMAVINCIGIWVFLVVGFLFIGRVIGLWIAMIFAPIAFVSYTLPDGAGKILGDMHHSKWWDTLLKQAFVVPIFMFFMYLILAFLNTNFYKDALASKTQVQSILGVIIPLLLITILLLKAKKIATDMSGEIGKAMTSVAATVGGAAIGLATGGAALAGQRFIGGTAKSFDTEERRDLAAGRVTDKVRRMGQFSGKTDDEITKMASFQKMQRNSERALKTSRVFSSASFDARQTGLGALVTAQTGMNMEVPGMFSTKKTAGGYEGEQARRAAKKRKFSDSLGENHKQKLALEDTIDDRKKKISTAEDNAETLRDLAKQAQAGGAGATVMGTYIDPATGTRATTTLDQGGWQRILKTQNDETRKLRKGEDLKWSTADVGNINPVTGATVTATDVGKVKTQFAWTAADVTAGKKKADGQAVTNNDVGQSAKTEFMSFDALEKAAKNNEKARTKAYMHQQMAQSGYPVHGTGYDQLGNVTRMGHIDSTAQAEVRNWGKQFQATIKSGVVTGMTGALTGAALLGPVGAVGGAIGGGILGVLRERHFKIKGEFSNPFDRRMEARSAELAADLDHKIHTFESSYKAPSSKFMDILKGAFEESHGGGGGHDEHTSHASNH